MAVEIRRRATRRCHCRAGSGRWSCARWSCADRASGRLLHLGPAWALRAARLALPATLVALLEPLSRCASPPLRCWKSFRGLCSCVCQTREQGDRARLDIVGTQQEPGTTQSLYFCTLCVRPKARTFSARILKKSLFWLSSSTAHCRRCKNRSTAQSSAPAVSRWIKAAPHLTTRTL